MSLEIREIDYTGTPVSNILRDDQVEIRDITEKKQHFFSGL